MDSKQKFMVKLSQVEAKLIEETNQFNWWITAVIIVACITLIMNQLVQYGSLNMLESKTQYLADFTKSSVDNIREKFYT